MEHFNAEQVSRVTCSDKGLSKVLKYVIEGWPIDVDENLKAYHLCWLELSAERGCVLWGIKFKGW